MVARIVKSIDDYNNEDEIADEVFDHLNWYADAWTMFEHYVWGDIHNNPRYDDALDEFLSDMYGLCGKIASIGQTNESLKRRHLKPVR